MRVVLKIFRLLSLIGEILAPLAQFSISCSSNSDALLFVTIVWSTLLSIQNQTYLFNKLK